MDGEEHKAGSGCGFLAVKNRAEIIGGGSQADQGKPDGIF
jgi:hypothetical protein